MPDLGIRIYLSLFLFGFLFPVIERNFWHSGNAREKKKARERVLQDLQQRIIRRHGLEASSTIRSDSHDWQPLLRSNYLRVPDGSHVHGTRPPHRSAMKNPNSKLRLDIRRCAEHAAVSLVFFCFRVLLLTEIDPTAFSPSTKTRYEQL